MSQENSDTGAHKPTRILLVSPSPHLENKTKTLMGPTHFVKAVATPEQAIHTFNQENFHAIVLDLDAFPLQVQSICQKLKSSIEQKGAPLIGLTDGQNDQPKIEALVGGADDFIEKGQLQSEFLVRLTARLEKIRNERDPNQILTCGNLEVDQDKYEVRINGNPVKITALQFRMLSYFAKNPNRVLKREEIIKAVWKDAFVLERTVDVHIVGLRKKLKLSSHVPDTVYGVGYIFKPQAAGPDSLLKNSILDSDKAITQKSSS
ncbi:MAG: response regulator transcription factor, partial [Bdellovibrionales bacterium]|nr:response regulator transcription factor [Bdellovibrionales bacterium]